jgi:sugar/nucleoside kinase (ribokinase family)
MALGDSRSGLVVLAESLKQKAAAKHIIVTLANEGILIHSPEAEAGLITDRLPALNAAPKDVSGAGDCLLTCAAMALVISGDIWQSAYLGSVAAACQVSRVGNMPLTAEMLQAELSLDDGQSAADPKQSAA